MKNGCPITSAELALQIKKSLHNYSKNSWKNGRKNIIEKKRCRPNLRVQKIRIHQELKLKKHINWVNVFIKKFHWKNRQTSLQKSTTVFLMKYFSKIKWKLHQSRPSLLLNQNLPKTFRNNYQNNQLFRSS